MLMGKTIDSGKWMAVVNVFAASRKAGSIWKNAAVMLEEAGVPYKQLADHFAGNIYKTK